MIYSIVYNAADNGIFPDKCSGRITLRGCYGRIMAEYRALTRVICDQFGSDAFIYALTDVAHDDMSGYAIEIEGFKIEEDNNA